jgi:hypothetical protein
MFLMTASKRSQDGTGIISASGWLFKKKSFTMPGNTNVSQALTTYAVWATYFSSIPVQLPDNGRQNNRNM